MMNRPLRITLFAASAFVLLTGFRGGCGHHDPAKRAERTKRMATSHVEDTLEELDATEAQKKRILAHVDSLLTEGFAMQSAHEETKAALLEAWRADTPDGPRLHALVDRRVEEVRRLLHHGVDAMIDTHDTLTPEQRKALVDELH